MFSVHHLGVSSKDCHNKHVCVVTKHVFCRNKSILVTTKLLLWQIVTNIIFVVTKVLSQQAYFFLASKHIFCHEKSMLVAIKLLSQQTCLLRQKYFVMTNIILLWQTFCCSKHAFVTTKDMFCRNKHDACGTSRQWYWTFNVRCHQTHTE